MFDPIKGPTNQYQGPAVGLGTENGDNWHTAVAKINAGFKKVFTAIEGGVEHMVEVIDPQARKELAEVREELAALQIKLDALMAPKAPDAPPPQPVEPPDHEPPAAAPIADFSAPKPETAIPVTTTSTFIGAGNPAA